MTLAQQFGISTRELVAFTGAGGKTTLMMRLAQELTSDGSRVVMATTTKMGLDQAPPNVCREIDQIDAALSKPGPVMLITAHDNHKIIGISPRLVDDLFLRSTADFVLVEADGARSRLIKAPAPHEPVIPAMATTTVVVMGTGALGRPLSEVAHRVERAKQITNLDDGSILTAADCAAILGHPSGGLWQVPEASRVVVALVGRPSAESVAVADLLAANPHIERTVTVT